MALRAGAGLPEAVWLRRVALAEQGLAQRGRAAGQRSKVILHVADMVSVSLTTTSTTKQTVTEVEVCGGPADSQLLSAVAAAFPHIDTLRVEHLAGVLPAPALLTQLRVLQLFIGDATPQDMARQCASVAPYLQQITTLDFNCTEVSWGVPSIHVSALIRATSTSLRCLVSKQALDDRSVAQLCKHAPNLEHITCSTIGAGPNRGQSEWNLRELVATEWIRNLHDLVRLPQSPPGLSTSTPTLSADVVNSQVGVHMHYPICIIRIIRYASFAMSI